MSDPLATFRCLVQCPADAVRWASVLEATSPKAGNVHPGKRFEDLSHADFMVAADIAAESFAKTIGIGERIATAVKRTVDATGTNVNLGILLLLGPLVAADERLHQRQAGLANISQWRPAIAEVLEALDADDSRNVLTAIGQSLAGGLGKVGTSDVHEHGDQPFDLLNAMRLAQSYDRIARQYATGFDDLITQFVPVVRDAICASGDVLSGIAIAHIRLLALEHDTLIARKNGMPIALHVQKQAAKVVVDDPQSVAQFDQLLRKTGHHLNPGTTADLIAAAIYLLLRTSS